MTDVSSDAVGGPPPRSSDDGMAGSNLDEEGEWGEEDEGYPLGSENNNDVGEEDEIDVARPSKGSSSSRAGSGGGTSKSHHKSGTERRRKHHHRHHHSSGSGSSRSEKRRRRSAAAGSSLSLGEAGEDPDDRDFDAGLSQRLGQHGEDGADSRRGSSSRRRSDSLGDKASSSGPGSSPRKLANSHDYHSSSRRGSRMSAESELSPQSQSHPRQVRDTSDYGEGGGGGGDSGHRRRDGRDAHGSSQRDGRRGDRSDAGAGAAADEAEDGEILEDGELDDDDDGEEGGDDERKERNENEGLPSKSSRIPSDKFDNYSPSDRKRSSVDFRDRWKRDSDEKRRKKKLYNGPSEEDEDNAVHNVRSSTSPPSGSVPPAWGSGVSQAAAVKASPASGSSAGPNTGYRAKQGGRYGKSGGHGGQSPPGLYDSPSYSEDSDDGMMPDDYMDADDKEYENMRMRRAKKRGRDALGDGRKRGGPPRKKTLMEMAMSERPICKFYMDGKCAKGSGCPFNHDIETPRPKMEVCKYHLTVKGCHKEHCLYMHENYPCKYYHTGAKCFSGDRCKFSHAPLTEETRRALALRVAAEDIVDMEDPEYRDYRDYPPRDYDDSERDYDQGDYNDTPEYSDPRSRPSLLGSPPRAKKIPSLFEIKVTPPGQAPLAGNAAQAGRQTGFHGEANTNTATGSLNANMGAMGGGGLAGNMNLTNQQQQQQQMGPRQGLGLLGPGGPLPVRGPNAAMMMGMQQQQAQQQQQQLVRPGFGLAGPTPFNNLNSLQQQQQRALANANANTGNLPPVLNMLGSLIRDLQNGPGPASSLANMGGQNSMGQNSVGNMGQNNMGNMGQTNMGNMGQNNMGNMGQNNMGNMGQTNMGNMGQTNMGNMGQNNMGNMGQTNMGNMGQTNMGNMGQNNMGNMGQNNMGNMGQNNMGNMGQNNVGNMGQNNVGNMPPNSMSNMAQNNMGGNMVNRNAMNNMGPVGPGNNGMNMAIRPGLNMNTTGGNNAGNMGMGQRPANPMGPGLLRSPMLGAMGMSQAGMENSSNGGTLNAMGNAPVSGANMFNNGNVAGGGGSFHSTGNPGNVSNPGQEVGIMDVDYRVGQQQPVAPNTAGVGGEASESAVSREGKSVVAHEEEDSSQDLSELDKMRRQLEEQLRAEDERAAAEDQEDEAMEEGGQEDIAGSSGDPPSSTENDLEDPSQGNSKMNEAVVDIPAHLPRKQRELLKRIQQQEMSRQREKEKQEAAEKAEAEARAAQEAQAKAEVDDFYSSEEEGDNGEKQPKLTDVLKKLNQETSSGATTSSTASAPVTTATPSATPDTTTSTAATPSSFNIMQMIQAIKSKTGGNASFKDQPSDVQQSSSDSKKLVMQSPASPPASPTEKSQASAELGLRLQPLTVDPPVVSARPLRPMTYCVVKLSLSQARPYTQLPAGVNPSNSAYRGDPRVKWHVQFMERQQKKKASALGGDASVAEAASACIEQKRKTSVDEDTIASPTPENTQKPAGPASDLRLKKADPRLQKAGASPSSGSASSAKAVDPRLERAANRPTDPRLAARAVDPRLNRQTSLPMGQQGGFNNPMGGGGMGAMGAPGMNPMAGGMHPGNQMGRGLMGNPQMNMGMQNPMGGFRTNQMGAGGGLGVLGPGQMSLGMNNPMGGVMNNSHQGGPMSNMGMMMAGGMNRMGAPGAGMNLGMGAAGHMGNQAGGPINSIGMRPQMQGGIFVSGGGDLSTMGAGARGGLPGQMNSSPNMQGGPQGSGEQSPANLDPRLGGSQRPPNDPRLKNRAVDPRDPRDPRMGPDPRDPRMGPDPRDPRMGPDPRDPRMGPDPRDPRMGPDPRDPRMGPDPRDPRMGPDPRDPRAGSFSNPKDPRSRDPRESSMDMGSPNINERFNGGKPGRPAGDDRNGSMSMSPSGASSANNNPPAIPASLSQPPLSSLPPSLSLTSSSSSPPPAITSSNTEKPSGVSTNFDHRNDPRFKRVKRSAGPRAASMDYSSPLAGEQEGSVQASVSSASDTPGYNSYNRPKPVLPRPERRRDTPSPTLPDTLEDFDMPETVQPADFKVKDIFKSIDPTASPFC